MIKWEKRKGKGAVTCVCLCADDKLIHSKKSRPRGSSDYAGRIIVYGLSESAEMSGTHNAYFHADVNTTLIRAAAMRWGACARTGSQGREIPENRRQANK